MKRLSKALSVFLILTLACTLFPAAVLAAPAKAAAITYNSIPGQMVAGSKYSVRITVKNTGTESWTAAKGYRLMPQAGNPFTKAIGTLGSTEVIKPGRSKSFKFTLTGPAKTGTYTAGWRMVKGTDAFGSTLSKKIKVVALKLNSVYIKTLPQKKSYYTYEKMDLKGLVVMGNYNDGSKKQLKVSASNVTGFTSSRTGTFRLTINISGFKKSFVISVNRYSLSSVTVNSLPKKLTYAVGEKIDLSGMSLTGRYTNGKTKALDPYSAGITGFNSSKVAKGQVVKLTMGGKTVKFTVDIVANALMNDQAAAHTALNKALAGYKQADYSTANWTALTKAKSDGDKAIDAAQTTAAVASAKDAAIKAMAGVKTLAKEAKELADAKAAAHNALTKALAGYSPLDYSTAGWATLTKAKTDGDTAIDKAATIAKVNEAKTIAINAMAAVKVLTVEELGAAKTAAHAALTSALGSYRQADYSAANWTALNKAKTDGDAAIDAAATVSKVNEEKTKALNAMAAVKSFDDIALDEAKAAARTALNAILAAYSQSNYSTPNWQALQAAKAAGDTAINNATTFSGVDNAKAAAIAGMAAIKTKAQENQELAEAKAAARQALTAALNGYSSGDYSSANWLQLNSAKLNGDVAIDAATTLAGVNSAKTAALAAMDAVKTLAEEIVDAKALAKAALAAALAARSQGHYSPANWTALNNAKTAGDAAIDAATTLAGVASAKTNALAAIAAVKTLVEEAAEELENAKSDAHDALDAALASYNQADYSTSGWASLNNAKTAGDAAINAAASVSQVATARNNAIAAMANVKTLAEE